MYLPLLVSCLQNTDTSKVNQLIEGIRNQFAPDKRVAIFEVQPTVQSGQLVLNGKTNLPEAHQSLIDSLSSLDIHFIDSLKILPAEELGEKNWGLITLSVIPLRKTPNYSAEMVSQALLGTPVKVLDKKGGWYLIQTPDQYIGWTNSSNLTTVTAAELNHWRKSNRYVFIQINGSAWSEPDDKSERVSDMLLGNLFEVSGKNKNYLHIQFPDGRTAFVKASDCLPFQEWASIQPESQNIIGMAKLLLGYPYLWGGTSTKAVDCSGMVKTAYFSQGVILARDASQQARYGEILTISDSTKFQPGDLLFFGKNKDRITHVGMYIGDNRYIHSSGRVKINSLDPQAKDYNLGRKKDLVSASRILNSLNTKEIIPIKDHPWYN